MPKFRSYAGTTVAISSLPYGIFTNNKASNFTGLPNEFGTHRVMLIVAPFDSVPSYVAIDLEGTVGIYSKYAGDNNWHKQ